MNKRTSERCPELKFSRNTLAESKRPERRGQPGSTRLPQAPQTERGTVNGPAVLWCRRPNAGGLPAT